MRRLKNTERMFCHDVACPGVHGFDAAFVADSWDEAGHWITEECPHCFGVMHETPLDVEDALAALADALLLPSTTDTDALLVAMQDELRRQRQAASPTPTPSHYIASGRHA